MVTLLFHKKNTQKKGNMILAFYC